MTYSLFQMFDIFSIMIKTRNDICSLWHTDKSEIIKQFYSFPVFLGNMNTKLMLVMSYFDNINFLFITWCQMCKNSQIWIKEYFSWFVYFDCLLHRFGCHAYNLFLFHSSSLIFSSHYFLCTHALSLSPYLSPSIVNHRKWA